MKNSIAQSSDGLKLILGVLLAFIAINAFGGGSYGMMSPKELPKEWLEGSPFSSFFIPSLILFVVVGGSHLIAAFCIAPPTGGLCNSAFGRAGVIGVDSSASCHYWLCFVFATIDGTTCRGCFSIDHAIKIPVELSNKHYSCENTHHISLAISRLRSAYLAVCSSVPSNALGSSYLMGKRASAPITIGQASSALLQVMMAAKPVAGLNESS